MRYTLLEMTQRILESMGSDEVNSYDDTTESLMVAGIIKETYWYLVGRSDLPANHTFFNLTASGDNTKPTLMTIPSDVLDIDYVKYKHLDAAGNGVWDYVSYQEREGFIHDNLLLTESETNISTMSVSLDGTAFTFKYHNDRNPTSYTRVDDTSLVFNSYDSAVDTTLQSSKTLCYGKKLPTFTMGNTFIPQLDPQQFQLLLNEAKSQAFVELKQTQNPTSEARARKSFISTQRNKRNVPSGLPEVSRMKGFGRKV